MLIFNKVDHKSTENCHESGFYSIPIDRPCDVSPIDRPCDVSLLGVRFSLYINMMMYLMTV